MKLENLGTNASKDRREDATKSEHSESSGFNSILFPREQSKTHFNGICHTALAQIANTDGITERIQQHNIHAIPVAVLTSR